jgi:hypothetical protein
MVAIEEQGGNPLPLSQSEAEKRMGEPVTALIEFPVGESLILEKESSPFRELVGLKG